MKYLGPFRKESVPPTHEVWWLGISLAMLAVGCMLILWRLHDAGIVGGHLYKAASFLVIGVPIGTLIGVIRERRMHNRTLSTNDGARIFSIVESRRILALIREAEDLCAPRRLAQACLHLAALSERGVRHNAPVPVCIQTCELASLSDTSPHLVAHVLAVWEMEGLVTIHGRELTLHDLASIVRLAAGEAG